MKKSALIAAALFCAAAWAQDLPDNAATHDSPDTEVSQDSPDTAVVQDFPDTEAVYEPPNIAAAQEPPAPDTAAVGPPKIAVYVTGNVGEDEKKSLGTRMLASLVNSKRYKGIERSSTFLAEIDKEQERQRSGAIDDSQISALGKQFGVKYVCIADITPALGAFHVSARVVDVETAEVAFIGDATSPLKTIDDLTQVSDRVVRKMFNEPEPESKPESQAPETPDKSPWWKPKMKVSLGAGWFFAEDIGGGIKWANGEKVAMPLRGDGAYVFADAVYAEIFVDYAKSGGSWISAYAEDQSRLPDARRERAHFGLLAKYPLTFGIARLFPLAGAEYEYAYNAKLQASDGSDYVFDGKDERLAANSLNAFWVRFGGGADAGLGKRTYLRAEFLYGLRTHNAFELDRAKREKVITGINVAAMPAGGFTFKIGIGANF